MMQYRYGGLLVAGLVSLALLSCAPGPDRYLKSNVGKATQEDVKAQLGPPDHIDTLGDGGARWKYVIHVSYATYLTYANRDSETCYSYELTFDAQKVLRKWSEVTYDCGAIN